MTLRPFHSSVATLALTACFNPPSTSPLESETEATGGTSGGETDDPTVQPTNDTTTVSATNPSTTDSSESTDPSTGGPPSCDDGCDDGVDCTEDACVDGACINTPTDSACDDGIDCTADSCDATADCVNDPLDTMCDDGIDCTADVCDPENDCIAMPDDSACDDGVSCTVDVCDATADCQATADDSLCDDGDACSTETCDATLDCQFAPVSVLVLNGGGGSAPEDAVTAMGYTPIVTFDSVAFDTAFDAGGFGAIVVDIPSLFGTFPLETQTRLDTWIADDGRLVFAFWNLDEDPPMAATLDVSIVASTDLTLPVYPDDNTPVDFFDLVETFPSPLTWPDYWGDNGDSIALLSTGFAAARFDDAMIGSPAILVTHDDRVVVNGFVPSEVDMGAVDGDLDGLSDGEELLVNELSYVCSVP